MNSSPCPFWVSFSHLIQHQIKGWMKPTTVTLALGALADLSEAKPTCWLKMLSCANN
jgi:hypothetical protein